MNKNEFIKEIEDHTYKYYNDHLITTGGIDLVSIKNRNNYESLYIFGVLIIQFITLKNKDVHIMLSNNYFKGVLSNIELKEDKKWFRLFFDNEIANNIISKIDEIVNKCFLSLATEHFSCCSKYVDCSDHKKCLQSNIILAAGYKYKEHLDNGKIFYGINRNID